MANEPNTQPDVAELGLNGDGRHLRAPRGTSVPQPSPDGRVETQLRARVAELDAQLLEVARCLEDAETRAAHRQAEVAALRSKLDTISASRSWRMTKPIRAAMAGLRRLF